MPERYIDTPEALTDLCAELAVSPFIALDTEFMREKSYYPQLCLIQVATDGVVACIDPLALPDLAPLHRLLADPTVLKVLHAARQDLEIFHLLTDTVPRPVFDTQLAATLLGQGEQVGYGPLVEQILGKRLEKAHSRADWSRRPLSPEQIRYAADDVRYLVSIYHTQRAALAERGRLEWLTEDFAELTDPANYRPDPREMWRRVKGHHRLRGPSLGALQELAAWREQQAQTADRPRRWVMRDELLLDMAQQMPRDLAQLGRLRGMDRRLLDRHGERLLALLAAARERPRSEWPVLESAPRMTPQQEALADALTAVVRLCGLSHQITPTAIATRRDLAQLVGGEREIPLLHGWRRAVAGETLLAFCAGRMQLAVEVGELTLKG